MKKRILAGTIAAITAVGMLTGCGSSSGKYLKDIKASDYVDLCDYNGIAVQEAAPSVTDDYVNMYIQYSLSSSSTYEEVTDHDTVKNGDVVNIDYDGKIDGKEFDGGSSTGYDLTIGSGSFIDGFEDGLIGKKVGEKVSLNLKFPDDYSNADVAGKAVVFDVTINKIEKLTTPELTDEWVASQNIDGVTTVDAYKTYMKKKLEEQAQQTYDSDVQTQINQYLEKNCTFKKDPPTAMVDRFVTEITTYYTQYAQQYGMDLETFMNYINPADNSSEAASGDASASDSASSAASGDAAAATSEAAAAATSETAVAAASTADSAAAAATSTETVAAAISAASGSAASGEESSAAATSGSKDYEKTIREQAVRTVKRYIILQAIADKEKLNISNRDYKTQLSSEAADEGYSSVAEFKKNQDAQEFRETLMAQAVMKYLQKQAKITEPDTSDAAASGASAADASTAASGADTSVSSTSAAAASSAQDASSAATSNGLGKEENDNAGMGY